MKKIFITSVLIASSCVLSSCSVAMAAKKEGTDISSVQQCRTRGQIISLGGKVVSSERLQNGDIVEIYQFTKERGSIARALMHGVLDISTFGLWEAVGTPIEGCDSKEFFSVKVVYDRNENVKNILLN